MADCVTSSAAGKRRLRPTSPDYISHAPPHMHIKPVWCPHGSLTTCCPRATVACDDPPRLWHLGCHPWERGATLLLSGAAPFSFTSSSLPAKFPLPTGAHHSSQRSVGARSPRAERFAPGSWRLLSRYWSLVIPSQIRAVGLVCLL